MEVDGERLWPISHWGRGFDIHLCNLKMNRQEAFSCLQEIEAYYFELVPFPFSGEKAENVSVISVGREIQFPGWVFHVGTRAQCWESMCVEY